MNVFVLRLVVDGVQARDVLEETEELRVRRGVVGGLEERREEVVQELVEVRDHTLRLVHVAKQGSLDRTVALTRGAMPNGGKALRFLMKSDLLEPRNLDHPANVGGPDVVRDGPLGELVPLVLLAAVDRETHLRVLVLAVLEVGDHFLKCGTYLERKAEPISEVGTQHLSAIYSKIGNLPPISG